MITIARQLRLLFLALCVASLPGCAADIDDSLLPSEEAAAAQAPITKGDVAPKLDATLDADADCDALVERGGVETGSYAEFLSVLDGKSSELAPGGVTASTCTRVCKCCKNNGNRFCCSHCRFCSGPIGVSDGGVLAR